MKKSKVTVKKIAVIGAGIAGIACARTLANAGHSVQVFDKSAGFGGRMSTRRTPFGSFDHGAQFFTVRDERFKKALATTPKHVADWADGREKGGAKVAVPGMNSLVAAWAQPLLLDASGMNSASLETHVELIEPDVLHKNKWQLRTQGVDDSHHVEGGFDQVILAIPSVQAHALLVASNFATFAKPIAKVIVAPSWTLLLAFPQAADHQAAPIGPTWNARRVDHPRIGWLARESSKPGRQPIERWTVQASAEWSLEHLEDDAVTVQAKLLRAFAEVTGIKAQPSFAQVHRWRFAQTLKPLSKASPKLVSPNRPFLVDAKKGLGVCGDWCIGHRIEDGFLSGLELALEMMRAR
jgi:renalase